MSRIIKEFPPLNNGTALTLSANTLSQFKIPDRNILTFRPAIVTEQKNIRICYSLSAGEKKQGACLKAFAPEYDVTIEKRLDENYLADEMYRTIVERGMFLEESSAFQEIENQADELLIEALTSTRGIVLRGTRLEGNGFLMDSDGDRVASFENIYFKRDSLIAQIEDACGALTSTKHSLRGVFFTRDGRFLDIPMLNILETTQYEDTELAQINLQIAKMENISNEIPEGMKNWVLPPCNEYEDVTAYVNSRRQMLALAENSKEDDTDFFANLDF